MRFAKFAQAVQVRDILRDEYRYDESFVSGMQCLGWNVETRCSKCPTVTRQDGANTVTEHVQGCPNDS